MITPAIILKQSIRRVYTLSLCLIAMTCAAIGANNTFDISSSELRNLRTIDGLSDLTVTEIYRDPKGFVYFGNGYGIDRFDGVRTVSFPAPSGNEQLKKINTITSDGKGQIYAGNGEGLLRLDLATMQLERVAPNIINFPVNQIRVVGDTIYMATNQCLYKKSLTTGEVKNVHTAHTTFSELNIINGLTPSASENKIWLTGKGVLHLYDIKTGKLSTIKAPEPFDRTEFDRCVEIDNKVYLSTPAGELICYDIKGGDFKAFARLGRSNITSLGRYGKDKLYVSIDGNGIYFIDINTGNVTRHISHNKASSPQLSSNSVYSALIDDAGLLWVGYYQGGVDYSLFHRNTFEVYADDLIDTNGMTVRAFAKDGDRMLIGTRDGLHYTDKSRNLMKSYDRDDLNAEMVFVITKYNGEYYIGTFGGGIHIVNPATGAIRPFTPANQKAEDWKSLEIFAMTVDHDGKLWIGSNKGVHCINGQMQEREYNSGNSPMPAGNVYEIYFDSKGTGWFCAEKGVAAYDGKHIYTDNIPKSFNRHNKYREVYEDSNGYLYFIPDRGPLVKTDLGLHKVETLKTNDQPDGYWAKLNPTFAIEDNRMLWLGTTEGLKRVNGIEVRHFTNADGLPSPIFTLCRPVKDENGDLWFGNTSGLVRLTKQKSESIKANNDTIVISQVLINGKDYTSASQDKGLSLKEGENNIQVLVSDLSYSSPAYLMFEYMLEGSNGHKNWQLSQGISEISIYDLKQGDYTLKIRHVGVPSSEVSMPIHVTRSFPWLLTLVVLCIVLIVALSVRIVYHKRKVRAKELAEAEAKAKAQAEAENAQEQTPENADDKKYKTMRLSDEECKRILKKLDRLMRDEEVYRMPDLKIADLAEKVGTSPNALSFVFNIFMKSNYYDYINNYRIQAFKDLVATADLSKYTLSAISEKCGFSSRSSFFRSFKKATGMTPTEYIKSTSKNEKITDGPAPQ